MVIYPIGTKELGEMADSLALAFSVGNYERATWEIMTLTETDNGRILLNWLAEKFCSSMRDNQDWPSITGNIQNAITCGTARALIQKAEFIEKIVVHALIKAVEIKGKNKGRP